MSAIAEAEAMSRATDTPYVWVHPGRYSGEPCIGGHRLPTRMVADHIFAGHGDGDAMRSWGISRDEVLVACWFEARHGRSRKLRRAWSYWLDIADGVMWHSKPDDWATVEMPPAER